MHQPKDTDLLNGSKNKTHRYAVYKKPTSDLKIHIDRLYYKATVIKTVW